MFSKTPELYDQIYGSFKDYRAEAERIAEIIRGIRPSARRVLDVACGTGEHARYLRSEHGLSVDGLDIEPGLVELARAKLPDARVWLGDMADFSVPARYEVILCLFSSVGYVRELERVTGTLRCFRDHLEPDGVVVVEPWFTPDRWVPGRVYVHTSESDGRHVVRMSHSRGTGRLSRLEFHYLVGSHEGIRHETEHHELGLFTDAEMRECFSAAGLEEVRYDEHGLIGRGLYVAAAGESNGV